MTKDPLTKYEKLQAEEAADFMAKGRTFADYHPDAVKKIYLNKPDEAEKSLLLDPNNKIVKQYPKEKEQLIDFTVINKFITVRRFLELEKDGERYGLKSRVRKIEIVD